MLPAAEARRGSCPPPIKVDVDVVNILAAVRDKHNGLIANLNKDDFTLFEDGKPQTIKYFTKETDLPLTIGLLVDVSAQPAQPDRDRAQRGFAVLLLRCCARKTKPS